MNDTRVEQVLAALDDARTLLADVSDDLPILSADVVFCDVARMFTNAAIEYTHKLGVSDD